MSEPTFPLVTLAVPLYRSAPFFGIITSTLDTIAYPNLEIIISDRHCADDSLDRLEARYGNDPRFRFLRAMDEIGWVAHYNLLMWEARGDYMLWVPHDDSYPSNYVSALVQALQAHPERILAFGKLEKFRESRPSMINPSVPPFSNTEPWTGRVIFRLFLENNLWIAMRGVFRRDRVIERGLFIQHTTDDYAPDTIWLLALALSGPFLYIGDVMCLKRYHSMSTHRLWGKHSFRHTLGEISAMRAYFPFVATTLVDRIRALVLFMLCVGVRVGGDLLKSLSWHKTLYPYFRRLFHSMTESR